MSDQVKPSVLLTVAALSLQAVLTYVDPCSHKLNPQRFTQEQLPTCLILRAYLKTADRGIIEFLDVSDSLRKQLSLRRVPHFSILKKFADRRDILLIVVDCMLPEIVEKFDADSQGVVVDPTGLETTSASAHYQTRTDGRHNNFIKLLACVLASPLLPSGLAVSWGTSNAEAGVLDKASVLPQPQRLFADAGYNTK